MVVKVQVRNYFGMQKADGVARCRIPIARMKFLCNCRAADNGTPFKNGDVEAGTCEIAGAHEAIVASADDGCSFTHVAPTLTLTIILV